MELDKFLLIFIINLYLDICRRGTTAFFLLKEEEDVNSGRDGSDGEDFNSTPSPLSSMTGTEGA